MSYARLLVTGAPGWLGTRLVEVLAQGGVKLRCLVQPGLDSTYLKSLGAETVAGDIARPETLASCCDGVQAVVHCAGTIHPKRVRDFFRINTQGTANVLEVARKSGVKRFVHISSNSAQGFQRDRGILMVEDAPCHPESPYGRSKFQAEALVRQANGSSGLATVVLRPCMYYGPRQPERMSRLMRMVNGGRPIVFGDGHNLRSVLYLDNLIHAIQLALNSEAAEGETFWIGDERPLTTLEFLQGIARELGVEIRPRHLPVALAYMCQAVDNFLNKLGIYSLSFHVVGESVRDIGCSIQKATTVLGYRPPVSFEEGLRATVAWARKAGIV